MAITYTSHGAAGTVTGSKHLIEVSARGTGSTRILLDCGMFQGEALADGTGKDRNRRFGFDPASIDVLVLTHAHIDHSGLIPRLVRDGFHGAIWSTPATRDLCAIMLEDSARIQEYDVEFDRRHGVRKGNSSKYAEPLYAVQDVPPALALFQCADIGESVGIAPGVSLLFSEVGHILGSAAAHLIIDDGDKQLRLTYTGDVGRYTDRLLPQPSRFPRSDVIICESTYGDRDHPMIAEAEEELFRHVQQVCVENKGKLIIPAFSIGKTQEILYTLNSLSNAGRLPRVPVFVDSPLAINATDIVRRYNKLFRSEVREELVHDPDLFSFPGVEFVRAADRSKQLNQRRDPCIVVSASGMMEAGRVRHHLFHSLAHPENAVLVVGYCAPGTLGAELLSGVDQVRIFGESVPVRAAILSLGSYSAHADRTELVRYLSCQEPADNPRILLVHGVDRARNGLRERLEDKGYRSVELPAIRVPYTL